MSKKVEQVCEETQLDLVPRAEVVPQPQATDLLAVVARAAADPGVDVEKMQALLNMQDALMRRQSEVEFKAALSRIQPRMPRVEKHGRIEHNGRIISRFARYEDLDKAIRPLLQEEGFAIDFDTEEMNGKLKVVMRVGHRAGHSEQRQVVLPLDTSGAKNNVQGVGSTFTYGKRYLVQNFFNIVTTEDPLDDDGNGGTISLDQQTHINDLLKETKADKNGFLKFMGCSSIDAIPASRYQMAVSALERKRR